MANNLHQDHLPQKLFEQYHHLAPATLYKLLGQPHNVARSKSLEYDDLLQYAQLGLWQACLKHNKEESSFESYAINHIRWSVKDGLNRDSSTFKFNPNNVPDKEEQYNLVGIDTPPGDTDTPLSELIESDFNTEGQVINDLSSKELLNLLNEREVEMIELKSQDHTNIEIAHYFNVSPQAVGRTIRNIHKKLEDYREEYLIEYS